MKIEFDIEEADIYFFLLLSLSVAAPKQFSSEFNVVEEFSFS